MSFRELRNFTEIMRGLGYPRMISMENFRTPNFVLVSDILYWLVQRYDPNVDISNSITTDEDRILFLKNIVQIVFAKSRIKLSIKKLYEADGYAVKELLKLASLLKDAASIRDEETDDDSSDFSLPPKFQDMKTTRQLASELTTKGAVVYDHLAQELELREKRVQVISQPMELEEIEKNINMMTARVLETVEELKEACTNLNADEVNLEQKIEKKRSELERCQKRLQSFQDIRPAFMEEYSKLEVELQKLYTEYVERYRNLDYLENELEKYNKAEQEQFEENERKLTALRKKLREEELRVLRGEQLAIDDDDSEIAPVKVRQPFMIPRDMQLLQQQQMQMQMHDQLHNERESSAARRRELLIAQQQQQQAMEAKAIAQQRSVSRGQLRSARSARPRAASGKRKQAAVHGGVIVKGSMTFDDDDDEDDDDDVSGIGDDDDDGIISDGQDNYDEDDDDSIIDDEDDLSDNSF